MPRLVLLTAALLISATPALAQQPRNSTGGVTRYDTNKDSAVDRDRRYGQYRSQARARP